MTHFLRCLSLGHVAAVGELLSTLDEPARRALGDELTAHVRRRRDTWWADKQATALAVAAVGTLSTATKTATLLGRRSVELGNADPQPVVEAARLRGVPWLAEVAYRLAERLPRSRSWDGWHFVAGLLLAEKAPPPTADAFVAGWAQSLWMARFESRPQSLVDRLRADPFLDTLLPRLFEVDGIGTDLTFNGAGQGVPPALAALATEGRLDRSTLLDGVLGRLLRGDRPTALRPFIALHDLVAPTPGEVTARASAYLRLLADAPGPVAGLAQRALRDADGDLDLDSVLDTARVVLGRPEKALVRAQLSWLDRLVRQHPDRTAGIAEALASGVAQPSADLRDRALALAQRHGHRPAATATVAVPGDELPPPVPPALAPPPITDVDELVEEVTGLLGQEWPALTLERVLDGLARLATREQDRLAAALSPVVRRAEIRGHDGRSAVSNVRAQFNGVLLAAAAPTEAQRRREQWSRILGQSVTWRDRLFRRRSTDESSTQSPISRLYCARLAEIGQRMDGSDDPGLLAAPTSVTGAVDPAVLYERLVALGGRPAWRWDLTQALLRVPVGVDDALASRAAALGTPAGDELAGWLRGDALPAPVQQVVTVGRRERRHGFDYGYDRLPVRRTVVATTPPEGVADPIGLLTVSVRLVGQGPADWSDLWPALLPGHRGLVAARLLPGVASGAQEDAEGFGAVLPRLAECTGVGGPALDLALAYGLCARHEADRVAALDALLILAAAGELDAPGVGGRVGALAADNQVTLTRAVNPLRDAIAAGARLSVWRLLAAALPPLLAAPTAPRGTPDLLALATEAAGATGVHIELPGLADVAARGGTSRLVKEARRLRAASTG
ncbi:DUF6493 family protein [Micromonospora sp. WMMD1155]|uniref:DUF7824 domain-containing protein n=1 Tax=Micromonospora sp. WMMD1155 TaxID=3016094 RepID=UPI00249BF511|nr:DUF6493 family protein [Micromonospora sp. WMMD1155]WFE52821.1 DUF6493 family protein [Micromonospora sp. WMMD1155]